jgi:hypothetical protein
MLNYSRAVNVPAGRVSEIRLIAYYRLDDVKEDDDLRVEEDDEDLDDEDDLEDLDDEDDLDGEDEEW